MEPKILVYSVINCNINPELYFWKLLNLYEKTQAVPIGGPRITEWAELSPATPADEQSRTLMMWIKPYKSARMFARDAGRQHEAQHEL